MKAVELVIRKLMGEYEFVIIPGFGALLSHQIPAAFDTYSGMFSPPSKKLAFNEYLKLDDGLLANSISRAEGLSHQRAVDMIRDYADALRTELDQAGQAEIPGVGNFSKNVEGKLVFEPNTGTYFKDEWYGFEMVKASQLTVIAPAVVKTATLAEEHVEVIEDENQEVTPRTIRWTSWAAAAVLTGLIFGISFFLMNSRNGEVQSTLKRNLCQKSDRSKRLDQLGCCSRFDRSDFWHKFLFNEFPQWRSAEHIKSIQGNVGEKRDNN